MSKNPSNKLDLNGVEMMPDPGVPKGMVYLINERCLQFASIDSRTRLQRLIDWFMRPVRRIERAHFKFVKHFVNRERHWYFGGIALFWNCESVQDFCYEYAIGIFWPQHITAADANELKGLIWRKLVDRER